MKSFKALLSYLSLLLLVGSPGSCWAAFVERRATIKSVAESIEQKALETKTVEETEKVEKPDVPVVEQEEEEEPIVMEEEEPEETKEANADPVPAISHLKRGTHLVITDATVDDLFALAILSHKLCPAAKAAVEAGDELPVTLDVFVSGLQQLFAGYEAVRQTITYFGCPELVATTRIVIADNARTRPKPHEDFLLQMMETVRQRTKGAIATIQGLVSQLEAFGLAHFPKLTIHLSHSLGTAPSFKTLKDASGVFKPFDQVHLFDESFIVNDDYLFETYTHEDAASGRVLLDEPSSPAILLVPANGGTLHMHGPFRLSDEERLLVHTTGCVHFLESKIEVMNAKTIVYNRRMSSTPSLMTGNWIKTNGPIFSSLAQMPLTEGPASNLRDMIISSANLQYREDVLGGTIAECLIAPFVYDSTTTPWQQASTGALCATGGFVALRPKVESFLSRASEKKIKSATSALKLLKSKEAMSDTPTEVGASLVVALEDVAEAAAQGDAEANAAIKDLVTEVEAFAFKRVSACFDVSSRGGDWTDPTLMRYSKQWVQEEDCNFPPEAANDIRRVTTFVFNDAEAAPATSVLQVLLSSELADTGATTFKLEPAQIDGETGEFILLKDDEEVVDLEDPDAGDQDFVLALATDFDIEKLKNQAAALFEGFKKFLEEKNKGQQLAKPPPMATTSATDSFKEPIDTATELQSRIKEKAGGLSTSTPTKDKDSTKTLETVPEEGVPSTPKEEEKEEKVPVTVEKEEEHMTGIDPSSIPPVEEPVPVPEPVLHEVPETPTENGSGEQDIETALRESEPTVVVSRKSRGQKAIVDRKKASLKTPPSETASLQAKISEAPPATTSATTLESPVKEKVETKSGEEGEKAEGGGESSASFSDQTPKSEGENKISKPTLAR